MQEWLCVWTWVKRAPLPLSLSTTAQCLNSSGTDGWTCWVGRTPGVWEKEAQICPNQPCWPQLFYKRWANVFLEQHVVQEDKQDLSTPNGCSELLRCLSCPSLKHSAALVPLTTFLLQPKNCSAFMAGSAQLLPSFILWNGDICWFKTPSGLGWWLRISSVSWIWMWNE